MNPSPSRVVAVVVLTVALAAVPAFALTPDQECQRGRVAAAAKYHACQEKAVLKYVTGSNSSASIYEALAVKCVAKYASIWPKLQAKADDTFSFCDSSRFDTGAGYLLDRLTGLKWTLQNNLDGVANLGNPQDADNVYSWSASAVAADGTAYTSFLTSLNAAGLGGEHDWRLPTIFELATIVPQPCPGSPCIELAFGTTFSGPFWTSTPPFFFNGFGIEWYVDFSTGKILDGTKTSTAHLRAVTATR